ncbi:DUF1833 domain-containing protein, partial [Klebsiella pneumoniae]|uniref:DUF1833 domain-containing protein n=1 Tax=Klebsiella pneumoniae TaxID=573 RepID=UPI00216B2C67
ICSPMTSLKTSIKNITYLSDIGCLEIQGASLLKFALCNIDGVVSTAIRNALANRLPASLTYRRYISTDLAAPAEVPYTLKIKSGYWTATEAQITAGYMNILDTAWPRYRYTLPVFPGLRYMS